jgi:alkylhydroperoxidase family enzyme
MYSYPKNYNDTVRVPLPTYKELGRIRAAGLRAGLDLNVSRMFAGTGSLFKPIIGLIRAIFETKGVDDQTRELICLRCAKLLNAPYEWQTNVKMASNSGLTHREITAVAADGPVVGLSDDQELVCKATDELTVNATLTDETLSCLLNRYGSECTRKIIMTISWFNLLGRFLNGCRVPLETEDKIGHRTSPF